MISCISNFLMWKFFFQKKAELVKEYEEKLQNIEFGLGQSPKTEFKLQ